MGWQVVIFMVVSSPGKHVPAQRPEILTSAVFSYKPHSLVRHMQPTMVRAGFLAAAQLSSYDHTKFYLKKEGIMNEGVKLHVVR